MLRAKSFLSAAFTDIIDLVILKNEWNFSIVNLFPDHVDMHAVLRFYLIHETSKD